MFTVPIFSEPNKHILEYLLILNGAKSRWIHSEKAVRSVGCPDQVWSGRGSALGPLMSFKLGSGELKVSFVALPANEINVYHR